MEKKLNVLTVIKHPVGGIRTYLKYTYAHLDKKEYQFTILTAHDNYESHMIREDLKDFNLEMFEVDGKYSALRIVLNLFKVLRKKKIDVIHSQGFTAGMLANIANVFYKKPHIITAHGVVNEALFSSGFGSLKKRLFEFLLARADMIQCVSYGARENLMEYFPSLSRKKEKLTVVINGISIEHLCNDADGSGPFLREELGIHKDIFLFGYLGRFMPEKGFPYLIDAVEKLSKNDDSSGKFKVLAVNDGSFIREYKAMIKEKNISDYFIFYGFTPNVGRVIKALDAVVIPSVYEGGWPLVAMEAFILGCPIIASNCIGLREVIANTPAVVIEKTADPDSIVDGLTYFMKNATQIKKDTAAFVPKAKERFDSKASSKALDALFRKTLLNLG